MENELIAQLVNNPVRGLISLFLSVYLIGAGLYYGWHFHESLDYIVDQSIKLVKCIKSRTNH